MHNTQLIDIKVNMYLRNCIMGAIIPKYAYLLPNKGWIPKEAVKYVLILDAGLVTLYSCRVMIRLNSRVTDL